MKQRTVGLAVATLLIGALLIVVVNGISRSLLGTPKDSQLVNCTNHATNSTTHVVTIKNGKLTINGIKAKPCDTLTIVNADDQLRLMAFGVHEKHQTYGGITEETLKPGEQMSVMLEQTGTYTFHDHLHDEVKGTFTVQ